MNIGAAAKAAGVSAKTIRYYETIGLVPEAGRGGNNYRDYTTHDVATLSFIRRARRLGFSLKDVRLLLRLWQDRSRSSADVKALAMHHVAEMDRRIAELTAMRRTLLHLAERCYGDDRPECPILATLAGDAGDAGTLQDREQE